MRFVIAVYQNESRFEGHWTRTVEALLKRVPMTLDETGGVRVRIAEVSEISPHAVGSDAVMALDLMDSDDIRERGAGRNMLRMLIAHV